MITFIAAIIIVAVLIISSYFYRRYRSHNLNKSHFSERWHDLQKHCKTRKTWPLAIIDADNLLKTRCCTAHIDK
jgi:heme/copper-type cytochrome/quinol oxidase subunit 2